MTRSEPTTTTVLDSLREQFATRVLLVSPPRTGSTVVARLLWQHSAISHHCHEPFEGMFWGGPTAPSPAAVLSRPMDVAAGTSTTLDDVPDGSGLLIKEMSFQLDVEQFGLLADVTGMPVVFVVRDPRLATTSRLRIVAELFAADTFPPFQSGWPSLFEQVRHCQARGVPHLIVDSNDLRAAPHRMTGRIIAALGLPVEDGLGDWAPRPGLQLCAPEVGELMSAGRRADDPFYRRVLASTGVEPVDVVDLQHENDVIRAAGLEKEVAGWCDEYRALRDLPTYLALA